MTKRLELFILGGLGNQLIQYAYVKALAIDLGADMIINPLFMSKRFARSTKITHRDLAKPIFPKSDIRDSDLLLQASLIRLAVSRLKKKVFTDACEHSAIADEIFGSSQDAWHPFTGYFQRAEAFNSTAFLVWKQLAKMLLISYEIKQANPNRVVAHIRLGDYLLPENQSLFCQLSYNDLAISAIEWQSSIADNIKPLIVSDQPDLLQKLLSAELQQELEIHHSKFCDPMDDLILIASHSNIQASNSTFGLIAGIFSSVLWDQKKPLRLPYHWYNDTEKNTVHYEEMSQIHAVNSFYH